MKKNKIVLGEYTGKQITSNLFTTDLKDNEVVVLKDKKGKVFLLSNTNANGGLCDDCPNTKFQEKEFVSYEIRKIQE